MQPRRRVILLIEATSAYGRGCLRGIARYARAHGGWVFFHRMRYTMDAANVDELRAWQADGVIARIENDAVAAAVRALGLPTVDLSGAGLIDGLAGVYPDHVKIIAMAAEHLLGNGLRNLGFCGYSGVYFSDLRQRAFESELELPAGVSRSVFPAPTLDTPGLSYEARGRADAEALRQWLADLPKPVGIITASDTRGRQVLEACEAADLTVPEEVSVVGVDDDDVVCELSNPRLSSVVPNVEAMGFEAARILEAMMDDPGRPPETLRMPPVAVEVRTSSDATVMTDPALAAAVRFIRSHVGDGINVEDVLAQVAVSRSTLERDFAHHLGCTPHEFILRCRVERVKQLLLDTDYPLVPIARMSGFRRVAHMITVFRERTGQTPTQFRRATR